MTGLPGVQVARRANRRMNGRDLTTTRGVLVGDGDWVVVICAVPHGVRWPLLLLLLLRVVAVNTGRFSRGVVGRVSSRAI